MIAGGASHPVRRERRRGVDVHAGGTLRRVRVGVRVRVRVGDRVGVRVGIRAGGRARVRGRGRVGVEVMDGVLGLGLGVRG